MIDGIGSIEDGQAMISWLDGMITEKRIAIENIMATSQKQMAFKPQCHLEMLALLRHDLQMTLDELDEEIEGYYYNKIGE